MLYVDAEYHRGLGPSSSFVMMRGEGSWGLVKHTLLEHVELFPTAAAAARWIRTRKLKLWPSRREVRILRASTIGLVPALPPGAIPLVVMP